MFPSKTNSIIEVKSIDLKEYGATFSTYQNIIYGYLPKLPLSSILNSTTSTIFIDGKFDGLIDGSSVEMYINGDGTVINGTVNKAFNYGYFNNINSNSLLDLYLLNGDLSSIYSNTEFTINGTEQYQNSDRDSTPQCLYLDGSSYIVETTSDHTFHMFFFKTSTLAGVEFNFFQSNYSRYYGLRWVFIDDTTVKEYGDNKWGYSRTINGFKPNEWNVIVCEVCGNISSAHYLKLYLNGNYIQSDYVNRSLSGNDALFFKNMTGLVQSCFIYNTNFVFDSIMFKKYSTELGVTSIDISSNNLTSIPTDILLKSDFTLESSSKNSINDPDTFVANTVSAETVNYTTGIFTRTYAQENANTGSKILINKLTVNSGIVDSIVSKIT